MILCVFKNLNYKKMTINIEDLKKLLKIDETIKNRLKSIGEYHSKLSNLMLTNKEKDDIPLSLEQAENYANEKKFLEEKIKKLEIDIEIIEQEAQKLEKYFVENYPHEKIIKIDDDISFKIEDDLYGEKSRKIKFVKS